MPRPQRCRKVCSEPEYSMFYPAGFASGDTVTLTVDEYEVVRLVDLEKLTHSQAAELMEISRTTATDHTAGRLLRWTASAMPAEER